MIRGIDSFRSRDPRFPRFWSLVNSQLLVAFLIVLSLCPNASADQINEPPQTVDLTLNEMITQVQLALSNTQRTLYDRRMPPLKSVQLEVQTLYSYKAGGGFNLYIVSANADVESNSTQRILLILSPPSPQIGQPVTSSKVISETLTEALTSAALSIQAARDGTPPLAVQSVEIELSFVVAENTSGGAALRIVPLGFDGSVKQSSGAIQKVTVDFSY